MRIKLWLFFFCMMGGLAGWGELSEAYAQLFEAMPVFFSQGVSAVPAGLRAVVNVRQEPVSVPHHAVRDLPGLGFYDWNECRRAYEVETALRMAL